LCRNGKNAQIPVVGRRRGERVKSTLSGSSRPPSFDGKATRSGHCNCQQGPLKRRRCSAAPQSNGKVDR
jgi:hypothetical protein